MGLRSRTTSTFLLCIAVAALMAVLVSRYFFLRSFSEIEETESLLMLKRAQALMDDDLDQLEIQVRDWAIWDDTYDFINNGTQNYIDSNLQDSTFETLGLSGILFLDQSMRMLFAYEADHGLAEILLAAGTLDSWLDAGSQRIVRALNTLHLAVGIPIQTSDGQSPSSGLLIMIRPLDQKRIDRYSNLLGIRVFIDMSEGDQYPLESVKTTDDHIIVSRWLHTTSGTPMGVLSVESPRTISKHGARSLSFYLVSVTATLGIIALVSLLLLETMVFRQLKAIGSQLSLIASGIDPDARLTIPMGDEIGLLAEMMNRSLDTQQSRLKERETMLREIHHRVKNNLQIIASLLNLQSAEIGNPSASHALNEGRRRVLAMAFIHDELYSENDLTMIDLGHFLDGFSRFFEPEQTGYGMVSRYLESDATMIEIDQAVPIGLVLSEALANCYQHAFPEGRNGSIMIEAKTAGATEIMLKVRDDGTGLKSGGSHKPGLGLALMEALADQLHGKVILEALPEGGTVVSLHFPRSRGNGQARGR